MMGIYFVGQGHTTRGALAAIYSLYGKFANQFLQNLRDWPLRAGRLQ